MNYLVLITENNTIAVSLRAILKNDYFIEDIEPKDALKIVSERRPRVILLDSQFGAINSIDVMAELLAYDPTLTIVKIVSSFDNIAKQSLEFGAFEVVEKPFDIERIKHIIKRAMEREKLMKLREDDTIQRQEKKQITTDMPFESEGDAFFQSFLQIVAENFSDIEKTGIEVLKIIKKRFQFNRMLILLKKGASYVPSISMGIGDVLNKVELMDKHPLILWFLNKGRIFSVVSGKDAPFECRGFMDIINCRIAFPLKTLKGELLGVFFAGDKITGEEIIPAEITSLSMIMDYLSTVLENAFLYKDIFFHKEYQEAIFHNIPAGIIAVDKDGKIVVINTYAEEILNAKSDDITNKPIEKVGSQIADFIRRVLISGETFNRVEIEFIPAKVMLGLSTNAIKDEYGCINGAVAIFQNLTIIKEMERKEKEAEKNKYWSSLASRLSHELKNPLVAINAFAQMLPAKYSDKEFRGQFSDVVQTEVLRINEIIDRINKIADTMELKTVPMDIAEFFKKLLKERHKNNSLKFQFSGEERIFAQLDAEKIKEAIGYIMDFIYDDTGGDGNVSIVFCMNKDKNIEIDIEEKGDKIKLQCAEEIFVPFGPSVKSTISMGVMLARKIFELHGGGIRCNILPSGKNLIITLPTSVSENERNLVP